jgi:methanogenic corrinoid protein MtbC1
MNKDLRKMLVDSMRELDELHVLQYTVEMKLEGISSLEIFDRLLEGVSEVDALYEAGRYFIADLIMAGHILKSVMTKVLVFKGFEEYASFGTVVIATVRGDIHELGKNVITELLKSNGFTVHDLGADVATESIVRAVREYSPHMLILSGTLTKSADEMAACVSALQAAGLRGRVRLILGGGAVTAESALGLGADAYSASVKDCLKMCYDFMLQATGESVENG